MLKQYLDAGTIRSGMGVIVNKRKNEEAVGDQETSEEDYVAEDSDPYGIEAEKAEEEEKILSG